jgi:2',3'-cyclic-nucleotide 2'-phosphodiesterase
MALRFVMLGDIVGKPGRRVVEQQIATIRQRYEPDIIVANAENIAGGSGITPQLFQRLLSYGLSGVTLGDHAYRQKEIIPFMDSAANLIRPANLPQAASGRSWMKVAGQATLPPVYMVTLLGRIYMAGPPADDPFATIDRMLRSLPRDGVVVVEMHCEATSEKIAMGHYLDGRVAAVLGTHTHVPTADARVLPGGTAFITDLGMCGPYDSIIGRRKERVLHHMTTAMPIPFEVAEGDVRACGAVVEISSNGRAASIERIELPADLSRPPFLSNGEEA